jgi:hypothetical protein
MAAELLDSLHQELHMSNVAFMNMTHGFKGYI